MRRPAITTRTITEVSDFMIYFHPVTHPTFLPLHFYPVLSLPLPLGSHFLPYSILITPLPYSTPSHSSVSSVCQVPDPTPGASRQQSSVSAAQRSLRAGTAAHGVGGLPRRGKCRQRQVPVDRWMHEWMDDDGSRYVCPFLFIHSCVNLLTPSSATTYYILPSWPSVFMFL